MFAIKRLRTSLFNLDDWPEAWTLTDTRKLTAPGSYVAARRRASKRPLADILIGAFASRFDGIRRATKVIYGVSSLTVTGRTQSNAVTKSWPTPCFRAFISSGLRMNFRRCCAFMRLRGGAYGDVNQLTSSVHGSGKVTFLIYDDFENKLLPELQNRIKANLRTRWVEAFDHRVGAVAVFQRAIPAS